MPDCFKHDQASFYANLAESLENKSKEEGLKRQLPCKKVAV